MKRFITGILVCITHVAAYSLCDTHLRFAFGPAWHYFFSYERFSLTQLAQDSLLPTAETITANYDLMPYAQGTLATSFKNVIFQIQGAGGKARKGTATIDTPIKILNNYFLPFFNNGPYNATIQQCDILIGYLIPLHRCNLTITPLIGYTLNQENVCITEYGLPNTYSMHNRWKGPYIGIKGIQEISCEVSFAGSYKCVLGDVRSKLATTTTPSSPLMPPDTSFSNRTAHMLGTLLEIELLYAYRNNWNVGTTFSYNNYSNRHTGKVFFPTASQALVTQAKLEKIQWIQLLWTFFIEYTF